MIGSETRAQMRTDLRGILELCAHSWSGGRFEQNMIRAESGEVAFDSTSGQMKYCFPTAGSVSSGRLSWWPNPYFVSFDASGSLLGPLGSHELLGLLKSLKTDKNSVFSH